MSRHTMKHGLVYILCLSLGGFHLSPVTQRFDCVMSGQRNQPACCCGHGVAAARPESCCIGSDGKVSHLSTHRAADGAVVTWHMTAVGSACCNAIPGNGTTAVVTNDATHDKSRLADGGRVLWPALTASAAMADLARRDRAFTLWRDSAHGSIHSPGRLVLHCTFLI